MKCGELCESARQGFVCPDDICRGSDITLCGFDVHFYESEIMHGHYDDELEDGLQFGEDEEEALESIESRRRVNEPRYQSA